jgi:hypothetical protein
VNATINNTPAAFARAAFEKAKSLHEQWRSEIAAGRFIWSGPSICPKEGDGVSEKVPSNRELRASYAAATNSLNDHLDRLVAQETGFGGSFIELVEAQRENGYRPSFYEKTNPAVEVLADAYDFVAKLWGLPLTSYRPEQAKPIPACPQTLPAGLPPLPACIRDDKRGFYNSNGYASQIVQFIEAGRIADAVLLAVRVAGNDHRHAADIRDWFSRAADSLKHRLDDDRPAVLTLQWIKDRCRQLRDIAHAEAKTVDCKFIRSRGFEYRLCSEDDVIEGSGPGCKEPTLKGLRADAARCREQGGSSINISGGYDGSDDFEFSDYQPFVTEWSLTLSVDEILAIGKKS